MAVLHLPPSLRRFNRVSVPAIHSLIDGMGVLRAVRLLCETDRRNSFDAFLQTALTMVRMYERHGVPAETWPVPTAAADGSGTWVIQEASDVRMATVDVEVPVRRRIADFDKNPWNVVQWSAGTKRGGVTSDLVVIDSWEDLRSRSNGSLKGKIILTVLPPWHAAHEFARTGADGILASVPTGSGFGAPPRARQLPGATEWTKLGWGGLPMEHAGCRLVAVALSPRTGSWLRDLHKRHGPVRVRTRVEVQRHQGRHDLVSGLIRGTGEAEEEIWVLAHGAEPGAVDNASGMAACVAAAGAIEGAIRNGAFPRPRRTIRFLNGYECYSFFPFLEGRVRPPLAGLVLDAVGLKPEHCRGRMNWHPTVSSSASFVDEIGEGAIRGSLSIENPGYRLVRQPWVSTDDTLAGDPRFGFPCPWLNTHYRADGVAFDQYHTSRDTPSLLSARGLRACATAAAAYVLYLAAADADTAAEMARAHTANVVADLQAARRTKTRSWAEYRVQQHHVSMERLRLWAEDGEVRALQGELRALERDVRGASGSFGKNTRRVAAGPSDARRVPIRLRALAPDPENLRPETRARLCGAGLGREALFWADGRRTIAEIARLHSIESERAVSAEQALGYFEALAEAGFVRMV